MAAPNGAAILFSASGVPVQSVPVADAGDILPEGAEAQMLAMAREKARRLQADLSAKQAELDANPPAVPPEQLVQGRAAMRNAIAAATRMIQSLDDAAAIAGRRDDLSI